MKEPITFNCCYSNIKIEGNVTFTAALRHSPKAHFSMTDFQLELLWSVHYKSMMDYGPEKVTKYIMAKSI